MTAKKVCALFGKLFVAGATLIALNHNQAAAQKVFSVQTKWVVGGVGGWDYLSVDPSAPHLYVTHGPRVDVLDTNTGKIVGNIPGLKGTHGVAFDDAGKFGYISDGGANVVIVFDRSSLEKIASIPAGTNPDGIVFEPHTKTVWAFNGRSANVTVIDTTKRIAIATIPLPGKPEFPTVDGSGTVFVNIEDKNEIVRLDALTNKATDTWPLTGCDSPSGMAIDVAGHRLFSVCDGKKMVVTDSKSGKFLASPTIGDGPDAAAYDDARKLAFSSNGDGTLTIVDAGKHNYPILQSLPTQKGARTMAFDRKNGRIYLVSAEFGPKPAATADNPRPRPSVIAGTFTVLVVGRD
ncbi:YncE family protein [Tunturiibacter lichenicola]|jgi:DNA-binding beta-propeller fold protein YncE|uniref:YncE family protein n=1 Tax=Tunturiibacter lichenicola TaxID=2051959 RepID=UPI003D9BF211